MNNLIGKTISHYKIIELVGQGGMGVVYKAEDTKLKRKIALKFLPAHLTANKEAIERFEREAQATAALNHPNIITIYEIGEFNGQIFIAIEYVAGQTLREKITGSPLPIYDIIDIATRICEGLSKAHQAGIVHRDIKPENILIGGDGRVKIVDFGLAKLKGVGKLTKERSTMGTIHYLSPEQARGEEVDHRADIWSLGILLYEMVTREIPFKGEYEQVVIFSILNEEPKSMAEIRPGVPTQLEHIVIKALEKNPTKRQKDIDEILSDLAQVGAKAITKGTAKPMVPWRRPFYLYGGIILLVALVVLIGIYFLSRRDKVIDSIAVLPLQNLSKHPEQEYFSDGMTDALITELGKIKALRVISRTSVIHYKQTDKSLPDIARELNVDAIVEGSVLQAEGKVRIIAKLIEATKDQQIWSDDYQRKLNNILVLQSEIAQAIARQIKIAVTPEEQKRLARNAYQVNPEAHEAYLRGRFFVLKWTEEDIRQGITYFEQAIEKDYNYAPAYVGLARGYEFLIWLGWLSPKQGWPIVEEKAQKALKINEILAEAHVMLAEVKKLFDYDWEEAESGFKRAIEINPGFAFAHQAYAWYLSARGQHDEAIAEIELAKKFDPLSAHNYVTAGWLYYQARRYENMVSNIKEALKIDPNFATAHMILGTAYLQQKMYDEAIAEMLKAIDLKGGNMPISELARAYALSGHTEKAYRLVDELIKKSSHKYVPSTYIATIYIALGEKDLAFDWLNKAYKERTHDLITLKVRPWFDTLCSDARFTALLKKIRLE